LDGSAPSLDMGIGTTVEVFQAVGTLPALIDILKSFVKMGPILEAVCLSIMPEMLSGQLALDVSRLDNISNTSSSEQSNSAGQSKGFNCCNSSLVRGGKDWLRRVGKKALRALVFSQGLDATFPSCRFRSGI